MIHLIIDDKPIVAPEGTNIFQAALDNNIYIPGLCYHPKLSQFGGCRLCCVEVTERKRTRRRFACAHPVSEGMTVKVNTPEVDRYRKAVMEYLLAHHELSCPTCNKSGECGLQDITQELNLPPGRFNTVRMSAPVVRDNPVLELNRNRCILCGRCVNACKEIEGVGAIDFQNRGFNTIIGTAFERHLECSFCGGCLSVCPTGAWQDRTLKFRGRPWEFNRIPTTCPHCAVGCTFLLNTKNEQVCRVITDDKLGINEGNLCIKGRFGHEFIHSPERLNSPLIRKNGELQPVTWEEAADFVSNTFKNIIRDYGATAIGGIGSEKCTNEDNYLFQKFCRAVLGTNNIDNISNMRAPLLNNLLYKSVKSGIASFSLKAIETANVLFFLGEDITEAHPVAGSMARKATRLNNANLIMANMRNVVFNNYAKKDIRLKYKPGSQILLLNAIIKIIIEEKLVDIKTVEKSVNNLNELFSSLEDFSIENAVIQTGLSRELLKSASELLIKPGNCCIICGKDVVEDPLSEDTIKSLMNLCMLINASYREDIYPGKASIFFSRHHNNSQGVNDMGVVPDFFPGYLSTHDKTNREKIQDLWKTNIPEWPSSKEKANIVDKMKTGEIKSLYIMGEDPLINYPYGQEIRDAFGRLEFIVVQDCFLTDTAKQADVVLPTVSFAEREGTYTNMGLTVQRLNKAISSRESAKPDWEIISILSEKMDTPFSYKSAKDISEEIEKVSPVYAGLKYERLRRMGFHWPSSMYDKTKAKKYTFDTIQSKSLEFKKDKESPFILFTGASLNHQGTFSRKAKALTDVSPECFVEVNGKDAEDLKIQNGSTVFVESSLGKLKIKVKISRKPPRGIVFISEDYIDTPVNLLRNQVYTPVKISNISQKG